MAYTWTNGELITADKLNQTGGGDIVFGGAEDSTLDMTWQDIHDAMSAHKLVIIANDDGNNFVEYFIITTVHEADGSYYVVTSDAIMYVASSANGYPVED